MPKLLILGLLAAAAIGGWYLWQNYQIEGLDNVHVKPRAAAPAGSQGPGKAEAELPPVPAGKSTICIATFNFGPLDQNKISKPQVVKRLAQVIRRFDLVAVQDVQARNRAILAQLVEQVNADARHYNVVVPPDADQDVVHQYSAFLFDRATIQVDPSTVYLVNDPAGRFRRPPLVASFRARGPDASQAFTFTLVNVHADPERAAVEVSLLADVFRAVRDNGRNEDDILLLGDLGTDERHLGQLALVPNITCAIFGMPTTTRGTEISDNLLFDFRATKEFTGKSGVVDLMRELGLSMPETIETASHLPVWAEFSVYEGGQTGQVAESPPPAAR